jgi:hypothetical protein
MAHFLAKIKYTKSTIAAQTRNAKNDIHRGDRTQTHGQSMTPVSFRPTNRTVSNVGRLEPADGEGVVDIRTNP